MTPKIAIVIPCYNEAEALPHTLDCLKKLFADMLGEGLISDDSYILCVDDGSTDSTWAIIREAHVEDNRVKGVSLAHNRGHQNALFAGLISAMDKCDAMVSIDADLQDDPAAIKEMVRSYHDGDEIVYGVRSSRETDTRFKRTTARMFYKFQERMGLKTIYDHADFRLMSNRAVHILSEYKESNLFLRGIIPQIGLKNGVVRYDRQQRVAGESKYPLRKMISFSIDGITSFTAKPIRWIFIVGLVILITDLLVALYVLISYFHGEVIPGWSSIMLSLWFLGSLVLMSIGIVGEYIGKIFVEVKERPRYNIAQEIW